ncbi:DEAD/DEAH box helicase family protein [Citrobacter portucalensis]|uniref:DEAD/DEAH box helicase family protein n=1 Tax=Citrobacter portucalensis TaxID=1639133 RepID=UPI0039FD3637
MKTIFKTKYNSWKELEKQIEKLSTSKMKGDAFEYFSYFYFLYHKNLYQVEKLYSPVATGMNFPLEVFDHLKLERKDHGVDGVYITKQNQWVAYQAKFRTSRQGLTYDELATFWTEAENADVRLIITNSNYIPKIAEKKSGHSVIMADILDKLDSDFFEALCCFANDAGTQISTSRKIPRPYQNEILLDLINGLEQNDRGKLIAACGIGKTLIALWLAEKRNDNLILFLAPSLQLIRQTLGEWAKETNQPFEYLCVCSDHTVDIEDETQLATSELDIPVTTDVDIISHFLTKCNESNKRKVVFSTYQSVPVLSSAFKDNGVIFDITFYDEAHRTAGISSSNLFSLALQDSNIRSKKRIFMTATERIVKPRIQNLADNLNQIVFSMNDVDKYGPTFHKLGFGQAIEKGIVSDYRIVLAGLTDSELRSYLEKNLYVQPEHLGDDKLVYSSQSILKTALLKQCYKELSVQKVISFHSKINEAKNFSDMFREELSSIADGTVSVSHINGGMSSVERSEYISQFENADFGLLTNVRCLTEGIDIPLIDGIYFADPKGSLIDIIQAVGRALRQPYGSNSKIAYIIIPILIDEINDNYISGNNFDSLFNIIQALRDQDETLAEWIDKINLGAVTGRTHKGQSIGKLKVLMPPSFDVEKLESSLLLKIAEVNKDPSDHIGIGSKLGKNQRKSTYTRVYKTLCDYTPEKVYNSLVKPTLELITDTTRDYTGSEIRVNNNNVSHCERLGIITKNENKIYNISPIGIKLKNCQIGFNELFINQMLLFCYKTGNGKLYTYREALKFMREVKELGFIEFVYSLYSLQLDNNQGILLNKAIETCLNIKKKYPNIELSNESNKQSILDDLNNNHPIGFSYNDIWTDRTTTGNQFRYFIRHLELLDEIFVVENKRLRVRENAESIIDSYLYLTENMLLECYGTQWWVNERIINEQI